MQVLRPAGRLAADYYARAQGDLIIRGFEPRQPPVNLGRVQHLKIARCLAMGMPRALLRLVYIVEMEPLLEAASMGSFVVGQFLELFRGQSGGAGGSSCTRTRIPASAGSNQDRNQVTAECP
jgi:hypothetical protein